MHWEYFWFVTGCILTVFVLVIILGSVYKISEEDEKEEE
jgi:hypothetical protein